MKEIQGKIISLLECTDRFDINNHEFKKYVDILKYLGYNKEEIEAFIFSHHNPFNFIGYMEENNKEYLLNVDGISVYETEYGTAQDEYMGSNLDLLTNLRRTIPDSLTAKMQDKQNLDERISKEKNSLKKRLMIIKNALITKQINEKLLEINLLDEKEMSKTIDKGFKMLEPIYKTNVLKKQLVVDNKG